MPRKLKPSKKVILRERKIYNKPVMGKATPKDMPIMVQKRRREIDHREAIKTCRTQKNSKAYFVKGP